MEYWQSNMCCFDIFWWCLLSREFYVATLWSVCLADTKAGGVSVIVVLAATTTTRRLFAAAVLTSSVSTWRYPSTSPICKCTCPSIYVRMLLDHMQIHLVFAIYWLNSIHSSRKSVFLDVPGMWFWRNSSGTMVMGNWFKENFCHRAGKGRGIDS